MLWELSCAVFLLPTYILNLGSSDYYMLLLIANDFAGEIFDCKEAYENRLYQFLANRDESFYESGIKIVMDKDKDITLKCQQVIKQNGANFT